MAKTKGAVRSVAAPEWRKRAELWTCPAGCSVKTFVVRELDGNDIVEAGRWLDVKLTPAERMDLPKLFEAQRRERMRRSLVQVDGRPVNVDGLPFAEMDDWSHKTLLVLERAYQRLNDISVEDMGKAEAGVQVVDLDSLMTTSRTADEDHDSLSDESTDDS